MDRESVSQQSNEWTVVPRGKRRAAKPTHQAPGADKDLTLENLVGSYKYRMQMWRASTSRRALIQILDRKQPNDGWQIAKAVLFASGSFCRDNWECQRRSITQLVAFVDVVDHLQATTDKSIGVFAEELVYTALDVEFLNQMNVFARTASDVEQRTKYDMDSDCFVFEAFMDKNLSAIRPLLGSNARLFVGTPSPVSGANKLSTEEFEEMCTLYKQFDAKHSYYYFPTFDEDPNVFEGLRISWTNESEDD